MIVAADSAQPSGGLVHTAAVAPTLDNVLVLGLIVAIMTVLTCSLETEIEGVEPWKPAVVSGVGVR